MSAAGAQMNTLSPTKSHQLAQRQEIWKSAIINGNLPSTMSTYSEMAIVMPEYQPTLNGKDTVERYYSALNKRRRISQFSLTSQQRFEIGEYIFDIGQFDLTISWKKGWKKQKEQLSGKYWQTWTTAQSGELVIVGETFGFNQPYEHPERWVTQPETRTTPSPTGFKPDQASIELKAFAAIGRQGVMRKDGELRAQLYADDAIFYPYADTPKQGIDVLRPYLIKYSSHDAHMDWLQTHTHDVMYLGDYIYEFNKFAVGWTYGGKPEHRNGKGMRIWKRLANGQLRIYRHFGTHNHLP